MSDSRSNTPEATAQAIGQNTDKPVALILKGALIYAILGYLGLQLAISPGYSSPVFPAAGFGLAFVLVYGRLAVLAVFVGSLLLNFGVSTLNGLPLATAIVLATGIACGSTLQALLGSELVKRLAGAGWHRMESEVSLMAFLGLGGLTACLVSASAGVSTLTAMGLVSLTNAPYTWWTWYGGDLIGVILAAPLSILLFQGGESRRRLQQQLVPVGLAFLLAIAAFVGLSRWENRSLQDKLTEQGQGIQNLLHNRIVAHRESLASLGRLIEVTPSLTFQQFDQYTTRTLNDQQDIFALSYNPIVTKQARADFEGRMSGVFADLDTTANHNAVETFEIKQRESGGLVRASEREYYVPVTYISPLSGNRAALGYDINSNPLRKLAIDSALASGHAAVTSPIRLVQENTEKSGVLLLEPVFGSLQTALTASQPIGFAVVVLKVDEMIQLALQGQNVSDLKITVKDALESKPELQFYSSGKDLPGPKDNQFAWSGSIPVADRLWSIQVTPTQSFMENNRSFAAWAVGVGGLLLTGLLQIMLMGITGRSELVKRQVDEQTRFIQSQNTLLEQATRQAQAASEAKSRFLATMSHELRTPLNGILGVAKIIEMDNPKSPQAEQAKIILRSGEVLLTLLNDILDLSKIEAGKLLLRQEAFAMDSLINDTLSLFASTAKSKNIAFEFEWSGPEPAEYLGDATRIRQVLFNLISNAIKFTARGGVRVFGEELPGQSSDGLVSIRFTVKDTGCGIAPEQLASLFKPFSQLDDSYGRQHGGTGLGLSIVRSLAELMGGEAGVESELNQGSCFWFSILVKRGLPKAKREDVQLTQAAPSAHFGRDPESSEEAAPSGGEYLQNKADTNQPLILVVEDDRVNQTVIQAFLNRLGYQINTANSGTEALKYLDQQPWPALILLDLHMPEMDGYTTLTAIRDKEKVLGRASTPVVALTASVFEEERQRCLRAGMSDFLGKPVSIDELKTVLHSLLSRRQS